MVWYAMRCNGMLAMLCYGQAGVSISITSITDILAFALGCSSRLPALATFCAFAAVGILADYLLQISFFVGCMALDARRQASSNPDCVPCAGPVDAEAGCCPALRAPAEGRLRGWMRRYYLPLIRGTPAKVCVLLVFVGYASFSAWAASRLRQDFDYFWCAPTPFRAPHVPSTSLTRAPPSTRRVRQAHMDNPIIPLHPHPIAGSSRTARRCTRRRPSPKSTSQAQGSATASHDARAAARPPAATARAPRSPLPSAQLPPAAHGAPSPVPAPVTIATRGRRQSTGATAPPSTLHPPPPPPTRHASAPSSRRRPGQVGHAHMCNLKFIPHPHPVAGPVWSVTPPSAQFGYAAFAEQQAMLDLSSNVQAHRHPAPHPPRLLARGLHPGIACRPRSGRSRPYG